MRIKVIVNPGSGQREPVLSIFNEMLGGAGIEWDIALTHALGDGRAAARKAAEEGYDLIGVYGGDGTVGEVASALQEGGPPMAVFPGGTGNVLAEELGIPRSLEDAAALIASGEYDIRPVDMGRVGDSLFVVRVTMGFETSIVEMATRDLKERFGWLAYAFGFLQTLRDPPVATYRIEVDGEIAETEGLACIVANSAGTGVMGVKIADGVDISDGLLDVIVVESAHLSLLTDRKVADFAGDEPRAMFTRRGRTIRVESDPVQPVLLDGEELGTTPVEVNALPAAIGVAVPRANGQLPDINV